MHLPPEALGPPHPRLLLLRLRASPVCTDETIESVSNIFRERGSNAWFELEAAELLPRASPARHCGGKHFTKETDTLDGWFDSGSTHNASMELDSPGRWPAEMYLEGGDQFRGWFQSSLLIGVATKGKAPYKECLCHGWTVDGEGKAMHKSLGNGVDPADLIAKYGADIVRPLGRERRLPPRYALLRRPSSSSSARSTSRFATPRATSSATSRASTPTATACP